MRTSIVISLLLSFIALHCHSAPAPVKSDDDEQLQDKAVNARESIQTLEGRWVKGLWVTGSGKPHDKPRQGASGKPSDIPRQGVSGKPHDIPKGAVKAAKERDAGEEREGKEVEMF
jgi:hypothetical protein